MRDFVAHTPITSAAAPLRLPSGCCAVLCVHESRFAAKATHTRTHTRTRTRTRSNTTSGTPQRAHANRSDLQFVYAHRRRRRLVHSTPPCAGRSGMRVRCADFGPSRGICVWLGRQPLRKPFAVRIAVCNVKEGGDGGGGRSFEQATKNPGRNIITRCDDGCFPRCSAEGGGERARVGGRKCKRITGASTVCAVAAVQTHSH